MASQDSKLHLLLTEWRHHDAIRCPSVFAPPSILEPSQHFPSSLAKDHLVARRISEVLEAKLTELAPSVRKWTFLRDIAYVACSAENVAYLCKKDAPVTSPIEIRVESDILFVQTLKYDWTTPGHTQPGDVFLAIVTEQGMHCYEVKAEDDDVDFVPSFSVDVLNEGSLRCLASTATKQAFCGSEKGDIYELKVEKGRQPMWQPIHVAEEGKSTVRALYVDDHKGLLYALFEDSSIDVFTHRLSEVRRLTEFRPEGQVAFVDLFPIDDGNPDVAHLLGISSEATLFNFELDMRQSRGAIRLVKKLLRTTSGATSSMRLTHEATIVSTRLENELSEGSALKGVGFFEGLVLAVPGTDESEPGMDLYTVSRLPSLNEESQEAASVSLVKESIHISGDVISMHLATPDDSTRLFEGLQLGRDELSRQVFLKGRKFVIMTGSRVMDLRKRCPVEILMEILQMRDPERLDEFFKLYGPLETATMAVQLAATRGDDHSRRLLFDDHRLSAMLFSTETDALGELSLPARALLNYFRRLVAPLWDRSLLEMICAKDGFRTVSTLSAELLEWFGVSLEELEKFIESYMDEFFAVRFFDGSVFVPKCPAIVSEFELLYQLQDVVIKCKEIMHLIKILHENDPVYVTERQMKMFEKITFEMMAFSDNTPDSPLQQLITVITEDKEPEVCEAIVYKMDTELPGISNTKDKIYQKVLGLLKKAKTSPRAERQESLINKAMQLIGDQAQEHHIDAIVSSLSELQRHYDILQFVSRTAKKLVPDPPSSDVEVQRKARALRRRCYDHVFCYIADYIAKIDTDDDESADIPVLFGAVQCLDDIVMMDMMMEKLLIAEKIPRRSLHQPTFFEFGNELRQYLGKKLANRCRVQEGMDNDGVVLDHESHRELRLLVEICQSQGDLRQAGDWLILLAKRESSTHRKIPLIERIGDLNDARAMYESVMPESFLRNLEREIEVAMFQQRVLTMGKRIFAIMDDAMETGRTVREVLTKLVDASSLYRVINENFPAKIAQDLSAELHRIAGDVLTVSEMME